MVDQGRPTVLVVEDEASYVEALTVGLTKEGFIVEVAVDGAEALLKFEDVQPDLVLLDVMLPKMSGIDVCRLLRKRSQVPIIMVTAKGAEIDTVVGLEVGADDYVSKPYRMRELVARMRAVMRRHGTGTPVVPEVSVGAISVGVLTRDVLIDRVWGSDYVGDTKTLDVHVKRLRAKVEEDPANPTRITTIRGLGYKFERPKT
jgi:two-component system, OmpR family, response regulator RegX3